MTLTFMTYIIDSDAYGFHLGNEKVFNNFMNECQCSTLYIWYGFVIIQKYICLLMLTTIYECKFCYLYILSLVFLSMKFHVYCLILQQKSLCIGNFQGMLRMHTVHDFLMEGAPPGLISTPQGQGFNYPRWPIAFDKIHCTCLNGSLGFIVTFSKKVF